MSGIKTYPEMNAKIVGLLELGDEPMPLYAAQRIRELEAELREARGFLDVTSTQSVSVASQMGKRIRELEAENAEMLRVLQEIYKKHCMEIESAMGWNDLGDLLHDTLCNVMGTGEYNDWVEDMEGQGDE